MSLRSLISLVAAMSFAAATLCYAVDSSWTGAVDDDFLNAGNWSAGVPAGSDNAIIDGGANFPIVIPASAGTLDLGGFQLGTGGATGGQIIQNGGTLIVSAQFKSHIGDQGTINSSWIMNNDAVLLYDEPESGGGAGYGSDGDGQDLEIGAQLGAGSAVGTLELHDNAILRLSDDLKIADEDNGDGRVIIDGNAQATIGSGVSLSGGTATPGVLSISGNGLLVSGNSAGPGLASTGYTNEGYLTLSPGPEGADLSLSDNARAYVRTLQHRNERASITIENNAELHVFDVFNFAEPDLGTATLTGDVNGSERSTMLAQAAGSSMTITLRDNGVMTVDSAPDGGAWTGLALSGGSNRGGNDSGGSTLIDIRDSATFAVQQDLHMTLGTNGTTESTLKITGPDATVNINGDLRMSIDTEGNPNPGFSTLHSVISSSTHSPINVGDTAFIGDGNLLVELDGYTPFGGESFTLVSAGNVDGTAFFDVDLTMAELQDGLSWDLVIDSTTVTLNVLGSAGLPCDFVGSAGCDIDDLNALYAGTDGAPELTEAAISDWLSQASSAANPAKDDPSHTYVAGDVNLDGSVDSTDLGLLLNNFGNSDNLGWGQGNLTGDANVDSTDLGQLLNNFGSVSSASAAAVPEPGAGAMLVLLCSGLLFVRKKRSC